MTGAEPRRPFNVIDGMILVAAVAASIVLTQGTQTIYPGIASVKNWIEMRTAVSSFLQDWLLALSLASLAIRLRRPRATLQQLRCQPGFSAGAAVAATTLIGLALWLVAVALVLVPEHAHTSGHHKILPAAMAQFLPHLGGCIASIWATQIMTGCWKPESGWVDRLGLLLGCLWILVFTGHWLNEFFWSIMILTKL